MDENIEQKYIKWYEEFFTSGDCDKFLIEEAAFIAGYEVAKSEYEAKLKEAIKVVEFYANKWEEDPGIYGGYGSYYTLIKDTEKIAHDTYKNGKKAREFLKSLEDGK